MAGVGFLPCGWYDFSMTNHNDCTHPNTPAGRKWCRLVRAAEQPLPAGETSWAEMLADPAFAVDQKVVPDNSPRSTYVVYKVLASFNTETRYACRNYFTNRTQVFRESELHSSPYN